MKMKMKSKTKKTSKPKMEILKTISDIGKHQWDNLITIKNPEASYEWFKAVEDSKMRTLYYVTLWEQKDLVAACCCYLFEEEEFFLRIPFLRCRTPLSTLAGFFSPSPQYTDRLLQGVDEIQNTINTSGMLITSFPPDDFYTLAPFMSEYTPFYQASISHLDLPYKDFDEYLGSLRRSHRRSIRKTMNRAEKRWQINHVLTSNLSQWKHVAHRLQGLTCAEHNDFNMHLSEKFYESLEKTMKDKAELSLFLKDDIPLVVGLCLNTEEIAVHKFAGIDPKYRQYQAYFLLYYEGIRKAIERNQSRICFGTTTYQFKEKIGCEFTPLRGFGKMKNPFLQTLLGMYFKLFRPLTQEKMNP